MKEINPRPEYRRIGYNPTGKSRADEDTFRFRAQVLDLRKQGLTMEQIAAEVDRSKGYINKVYHAALRSIVVDKVADVRKLELERLDSLQLQLSRVLSGFTPLISHGKIVYDFMEDEEGNRILDEDGNPIPFKVENIEVKMKAMQTMLQVMDRRAKLLGLDAASKQEITGKDGGPIRTQNSGPSLTLEQLQEEAARRGLPASVFQV